MQRSVRSVANAALLLRENCKRRLDWTAHSMGCYLLLLALRDATKPFARVTLLAPDVPTWFFVDSLKRGVRENVRFLHCFHSRDEAVEISRQRRGLDFPVPGNGAVLPNRPGVTVLDCSKCQATLGMPTTVLKHVVQQPKPRHATGIMSRFKRDTSGQSCHAKQHRP